MPLKAQGEFALLKQHVEAGLKQSLAMGAAVGADHNLHNLLVDGAAERRDQAALREYAPIAQESAARIGHRLHMGVAQRAFGVAHSLNHEYQQAEERLNEALDIFQAYPVPWQIGRTLFELGELKRGEGKIKQAGEYYSRALSEFERLHAAPFVRKTREALAQLGSK